STRWRAIDRFWPAPHRESQPLKSRRRSWPDVDSPLRQILLRQHLAFFHRRLTESINAQEMRRDDGLEHEMHQQRAEAFLVEPREMQGAHRAAVLGERVGGGAALGGDEIANRLAAEVALAGALGELGVDAGPLPPGVHGDHGEQLVARTRDEELQL